MKPKVSLFYLYGLRNAGDAAIGLGALSFLNKQGYEISAYSRWPASFNEFAQESKYYKKYFQDIEVEGSPFYFRRSKSFIMRQYYYAISFLSILFGSQAKIIEKSIIESDLVALNGGNLMRCLSVTDLFRIVAFLYPLMLAKKHNIPYVIFPQSTVKLNTIGRFIVHPIFKAASAVWVREKSSLKVFSDYFPEVKFGFAPDLAFHIKDEPLENKSVNRSLEENNGIVNIAMTFRSFGLGDISELGDEKKEEIRKSICSLLASITKSYKANLSLIVQCDKDLSITNEIMQLIKDSDIISFSNGEIIYTLDTHELISFYETQDLLIGMRLHSIILALSRGIPCAGFFEENWGLKNPGLLSIFDLPFCFIGKYDDAYASKVIDLLDNKKTWNNKITAIVKSSNNDFSKSFTSALEHS